tara:strand:+ start:41 stop:1306 length:1266 start_codon:yes stop_codon:yes gene_type:complete
MLSFLNKIFSNSNKIETKFADLKNNSNIQKIFKSIQDFSTDSEVRYVGGCVRKILMNEKVDDIDLATNIKPDDVKKALNVNNIKFYETGIQHGTITAQIDNEKYEITSLRSDILPDGRHSKVEFTQDWKKDAERRDFTINSIYSDINGNLFDPFNGKADLEAGKVIFIGKAEKRIQEDYLRILRYLRFFSIYSKTDHDLNTLKNIKKNLSGISKISSERLLDEFKKIFFSGSLEKLCLNSNSLEILKFIFPQFKKLEIIKNFNPKAKDKFKNIDFAVLLAVITIDETDNLEYFLFKFNISKKDQKRIQNIKDFFYNVKTKVIIDSKSLWKHCYLHGKESLLDILNYKILTSKKNEKKIFGFIDYFKNQELPVFPIKAEDLMKKFNLTEGKKIGENLKLLEDFWIENNFSITEKDLERIVKN